MTTAPFEYRHDEMFCEGVSLARLADEVGTPVYVYSKHELERAYRAFDGALEGIRHRVCYAVKANSSLGVLAVLAKLGAGADIVSVGELFRWQKAGGDPGKVVFSGGGKTEDEMRAGLAAGIAWFNVESTEELAVLDRVARAQNTRARIALRVNPDVDPETHPYISTGLKSNKFGVSMTEAREILRGATTLTGIEIVGVDFHIGSQLTKTSPFTDAIARLVTLVTDLASDGIHLHHVDIGGGLGIDYGNGKDGAVPPTPSEYGMAVRRALEPLAKLGVELVTEPGRVIVGAAGALVSRVVYRKRNEAKHFTIIDAAMNDLMRPALYNSYHPIKPVRGAGRPMIVTDVVGPICETGDFLARDRELPELEAGELVWIGAAGAYGATMSSNYNTRPRAPEVLVDGDGYTVIRQRETLEHLISGERIA
ncbi:MAG: diaminopimelate decarboxylase [Deltaproteobacteria bacterium]|nr:diaminopimelate decarboxylase [Deltaproteobacteria bacterium]